MITLYPNITLTEKMVGECEAFSEEVVHTNLEHYKKRGQSNVDNIKRQILVGKLGEMAVHVLLGTTYPDLTVYEKKKKSFDQDLKLNGWNVHVKTQDTDSAKRYGTSWTFQYNGSGGWGHTDPLIASPAENDIVVLVVVDKKTGDATVNGIVKAKDIMSFLALPKLIQLYNSKRVIYAESIPDELKLAVSYLKETSYVQSDSAELQQQQPSEEVSGVNTQS